MIAVGGRSPDVDVVGEVVVNNQYAFCGRRRGFGDESPDASFPRGATFSDFLGRVQTD